MKTFIQFNENNEEKFFNIDNIIKKIKSGKCIIEGDHWGYSIYNGLDDGNSYSILPYDDDPEQGYYICSINGDEPISLEDVKRFDDLAQLYNGQELSD